MIRLLFLTLILISVNAQTDWEKWSAQEVDYKLKETKKRNYTIENGNIITQSLSVLKLSYWFLISDLDGDNCPFHLSCSNFLVESTKKTNLIKASLMFSDRFTRDLNLFKSFENYEIDNNRFYDPLENYLLDERKIHIKPENKK